MVFSSDFRNSCASASICAVKGLTGWKVINSFSEEGGSLGPRSGFLASSMTGSG